MGSREHRATAGFCAVLLSLAGGACSGQQDGEGGHEPTAEQQSASDPAAATSGRREWQQRSGLSIPRDDFATAVVGHKIWVFGGMSGDRGARLDSVEVYNTRTDTWRVADRPLPQGLASFEAAVIGDRVFVFGGLDEQSRPSDFSAVFDTSAGRWRELPPLPVPRYAHTVTVHDGVIYVIGGETTSGPVASVDVFHPKAQTWSSGAAMPRPRGSHDAVSTAAGIYVLGGWLDFGPTALVQSYDPRANRWARAEPLPEPVSRAGATVLDGRVWVSLHEFSFVLDLEEGAPWSPAAPLTVPRHGLGYVAVDDRIYAIGGCTESPLRDVRTVDAFDPGTSR